MKNLFKFASLLAAAVMLFSCRGNVDDENPTNQEFPAGSKLVITTDKSFIQTFGGDYATISAEIAGTKITEDIIFYDADNQVVELDGFKFSATKAGEYQLWANYGTYNSEKITIKAVDVEIPATPIDPNPSSTSFKARTLLTEFTTTGCTYCPNMKLLLHNVMADAATADKLVFTACHPGLVGGVKDPAFIKTDFDTFCGSQGYPYVIFDMYYNDINYLTPVNTVQSLIDELCSSKEDVAAGIAVNSSVVDDQAVIKVTVKSAETNTYRVGAFLLEDGIYGKQSSATEDWMHNHDSVIRYIDAEYNVGSSKKYYGHLIGEIEKGKTADYLFTWDLDQIWTKGALAGEQYGGYYWDPFVEDNLHLVVFVTSVSDGVQYVNNVIDCSLYGTTKFEYR